MIIKNAKLRKSNIIQNIVIKNDRIVDITTNKIKEEGNAVIDAKGNLVTPPFIDPHNHLDYALTAGSPTWNMSGTLSEGINLSIQNMKSFTVASIEKRVKKTLKWLVGNGVQHIRTHVNIEDSTLKALHVIKKVKKEYSNIINIQIVAFPQNGIFTNSNTVDFLENALKEGVDAIGGAPHFEFTREDSVYSVKKIFDLREKYDCMIDVHCDETDDSHSRSLEVLASEAHKRNIGHLVTASHTSAFASYNNAYANKLINLVKISGINIIVNPLINTFIQGRFDDYPIRRGITRVKEMLDNDINVCFGHDDF